MKGREVETDLGSCSRVLIIGIIRDQFYDIYSGDGMFSFPSIAARSVTTLGINKSQ